MRYPYLLFSIVKTKVNPPFSLFFQVSVVFILTLANFFTQAAPLGTSYDLPTLVAVQNRPYYLNKDLSLQVNTLPSDPFNKGFSTGFSYTHYFKNYFGWEVVNFNYNFNIETDLKGDLNKVGVDVGLGEESQGLLGQLDYLDYYLSTNLVYTPIYSKNLLFNETITHGEINFILGGGIAQLHDAGIKPLVVAGCFFRFFSKPSRSWKFDFRNNIYFDERAGTINSWSFGIAYSMQLGEDPREL